MFKFGARAGIAAVNMAMRRAVQPVQHAAMDALVGIFLNFLTASRGPDQHSLEDELECARELLRKIVTVVGRYTLTEGMVTMWVAITRAQVLHMNPTERELHSIDADSMVVPDVKKGLKAVKELGINREMTLEEMSMFHVLMDRLLSGPMISPSARAVLVEAQLLMQDASCMLLLQ